MRDNSSARRRVQPTESLFSKDEAASYCSRPTPLVPPPSEELREFGREPFDMHASGTHATQRHSSLPTIGPEEGAPFPDLGCEEPDEALTEPFDVGFAEPSARGLAEPRDEGVAEEHDHAPASAVWPVSPPALKAITIEAPSSRRKHRRRIMTRVLLLLGVIGVLGLAGHVHQSRLASAVLELQARMGALTATSATR